MHPATTLATMRKPTRVAREQAHEHDAVSVVLERQSMIELVHCVQRERGATCGWVASAGLSFGDMSQKAREATDAVLESIKAERTRQLLKGVRQDSAAAIANASSEEVHSGPLSPGDHQMEQLAVDFYDIFKRFNILIRGLLDETTMVREHSGAFRAAASDAFGDFARLKESTGCLRAFITGALALPEKAVPKLPTRAFADLVIVMQQTRSYEAALRTSTPPRLLDLIRAGFEYAPPLAGLLHDLMSDFNVMELRRQVASEEW